MTWEIVSGMIVLVGFIITIAGYASKLSQALSSLEITLQALKETLEELKDSNKASHKEFYDKLAEHDTIISILKEKHKHD